MLHQGQGQASVAGLGLHQGQAMASGQGLHQGQAMGRPRVLQLGTGNGIGLNPLPCIRQRKTPAGKGRG